MNERDNQAPFGIPVLLDETHLFSTKPPTKGPLVQTKMGRKGKLHRRCQAVSPGSGLQCQKRKKHNKTDQAPGPVHKNGSLIWGGPAVGPGVKITFDGNPLLVLPDFATQLKGVFNSAADVASEVEACDESFPHNQRLDEWWLTTAEDEIARTVPKVREYGATDLVDIGQMLARTMKRTVSDEEATELGIFFYLVGKVARWQSAVERGERPSDDTLFDISVYCRMAQRTRYAGGFPGAERELDDDEDVVAQPIMHSMCTVDNHDGCFDQPDRQHYPDIGDDPEYPRHARYPGRTA